MKSRAIALAVCGATLSACTGIPSIPAFNAPNFSFPGFSAGGTPVHVESIPAGADANIGSGPSCKTPCTLSAPGAGGTYVVTFKLAGYQTQTAPVNISVSRESWDTADAGIGSASSTVIDPDPVAVQLERAGAPERKRPPAASIKPKPKKPVAAAAAPGASTSAAPMTQPATPAPSAPPMPTPSGFGPPPGQQQPASR
jgi:PEGA domain